MSALVDALDMAPNGVTFDIAVQQFDLAAQNSPAQVKYVTDRLLQPYTACERQALQNLLSDQFPCVAQLCFAAKAWIDANKPLDIAKVAESLRRKYASEFENDLLSIIEQPKFQSFRKYFFQLACGIAEDSPKAVFGQYVQAFESFVEKIMVGDQECYAMVDCKTSELVTEYVSPDGTLKTSSRSIGRQRSERMALLRRFKAIGEVCSNCIRFRNDSSKWKSENSKRKLFLGIERVVWRHCQKYNFTISKGQFFDELLVYNNSGVNRQISQMQG
eukprot:3725657-Amphidinium_carterae.1